MKIRKTLLLTLALTVLVTAANARIIVSASSRAIGELSIFDMFISPPAVTSVSRGGLEFFEMVIGYLEQFLHLGFLGRVLHLVHPPGEHTDHLLESCRISH